VVRHTGEGILVLDADFLVRTVNPGFERITGYSAEEMLGRLPQLLDSSDDDVDNLQLIRSKLSASDQWEGTLWALRKRGEVFPMEISVAAVRDDAGTVTHHVMVFHDATAQKQLEDRLRELSATDGLTLVANRRSFDEAMEHEWHRAMRTNEPVSLIMADIDLFKAYNDTYGHVAGDQCLRKVAAAIADCCKRRGDLVARYGGEEFAVILPRTDEAAALKVAEKIREAVLALGMAHAGNPAGGVVTISLGVSTRTPPQTEDHVDLMHSADLALYRAKDSGRNAVHS
jgi:diguanylate cyclase (GGDEF)-like protein/PAS domain S-box-containing protein